MKYILISMIDESTNADENCLHIKCLQAFYFEIIFQEKEIWNLHD